MNHKAKLQSSGVLSPMQLNLNLDWAKVWAFVQQILPLILAFLPKSPTPATDEQKEQLTALGLTDEQVALNLDWSKLFALLTQLLPLIISWIHPTPTPAPGPTPVQK